MMGVGLAKPTPLGPRVSNVTVKCGHSRRLEAHLRRGGSTRDRGDQRHVSSCDDSAQGVHNASFRFVMKLWCWPQTVPPKSRLMKSLDLPPPSCDVVKLGSATRRSALRDRPCEMFALNLLLDHPLRRASSHIQRGGIWQGSS